MDLLKKPKYKKKFNYKLAFHNKKKKNKKKIGFCLCQIFEIKKGKNIKRYIK